MRAVPSRAAEVALPASPPRRVFLLAPASLSGLMATLTYRPGFRHSTFVSPVDHPKPFPLDRNLPLAPALNTHNPGPRWGLVHRAVSSAARSAFHSSNPPHSRAANETLCSSPTRDFFISRTSKRLRSFWDRFIPFRGNSLCHPRNKGRNLLTRGSPSKRDMNVPPLPQKYWRF